jgi:hypothetical protein
VASYTYGKTTLAILEALKERMEGAEITVEEAKNIYGGTKAAKVETLNNVEMLQIALLEAHALILQLADAKPQGNRAERRSKK